MTSANLNYLAAAIAFCLMAMWFVFPYLIRRLQTRKCARLCRDNRLLVLSFDDGPGPELTPRVLDLLRELDIKACFFFIGDRAAKHPDLVRRAVAEGHEVGGHSARHLNAWKTLPVAHCRDMMAGQRQIESLIGTTDLFRAPYGKMSLASLVLAHARKFWLAWWTIDPKDSLEPRSQDDVLAEIRTNKGGIVLLHDYDSFPDPHHDQYVLGLLKKLKQTAVESDLQFCTMSQFRKLYAGAKP